MGTCSPAPGRDQHVALSVLPHLACVLDQGDADEDPVVELLGGDGAVLGYLAVRDGWKRSRGRKS